MQRAWVALRTVIVFSACTHLFILVCIALREQDVTILNYFNILDLEYFFPAIHIGNLSQWFSLLTMLALLGGSYAYAHSKK